MPVVDAPNPEYNPEDLARRVLLEATEEEKTRFRFWVSIRDRKKTWTVEQKNCANKVRQIMMRLPDIENIDYYTEANLLEIAEYVLGDTPLFPDNPDDGSSMPPSFGW